MSEITQPQLTHGSLFSGIGGFDLAAEQVGWRNMFNCEINPFCQTVLKYHFPNAIRYTNILETDFTQWRGEVDILSGGFPCFTAGTKVLTYHGYTNIEDVKTGDLILTKEGDYKPCNATMKSVKSKITYLKAQGIYEEIVTTHNHPFWVRDRSGRCDWKNAGDILKGEYIAYRCIDGTDTSFNSDFWRMIGRFLGDGWILDGLRRSSVPQGHRGSRINSRVYKVVICCGKDEKDELLNIIRKAGYTPTISEERSTFKMIITNKELYGFCKGFGRYAFGKKLTGQCFQLEHERKKALYEGYLSADGFVDKNASMKTTTVSVELAIGMAQIARDIYRRPVSISKKTVNRICVIEGRTVNERPQFCVTVAPNERCGYYKDGFVWCLIKSIKHIYERKAVFNIGVEQSETYTANGIVVHNCQPFSQAGKRRGTDDERYLWPAMLRAIREIKPRWIVGENVLGIVNWNDGLVFEQVCADLEAEGYQVQPFVLPACGIGAPHRRYRTWFVAYTERDVHSPAQCPGNGATQGVPTEHRTQECSSGQFGRTDNGNDARIFDEGYECFAPHTDSGECDTRSKLQKQCRQTAPADGGDVHESNATYTHSTGFQAQRSEQSAAGTAGVCPRSIANTDNTRGGTPECRDLCHGAEVGSKREQSLIRAGRFGDSSHSSDSQEQRLQFETHSGVDRYNGKSNWENFPTQSPVCRGDDGLSCLLDSDAVFAGVNRSVRAKAFNRWRQEAIKAYGNAVVPPLVLQIFESINQFERLQWE